MVNRSRNSVKIADLLPAKVSVFGASGFRIAREALDVSCRDNPPRRNTSLQFSSRVHTDLTEAPG